MLAFIHSSMLFTVRRWRYLDCPREEGAEREEELCIDFP